MRARRRRTRRAPALPLGKRLLFSGLVTLVAVALLEGLGRLLFPAPTLRTSGLSPHDRRGWTLPASATFTWAGHTVTTNSLGLRSPEPRTAGVQQRVLVLGDSSIFGDGVADDQTFSAALSALVGPSVDVQSGGVPGYACPQAADLLTELRPAYDPDLVLVYSMHNDARFVRARDLPWLAGTPGPLRDLGLMRLVAAAVHHRAQASGRTRTPVPEYRTCLAGLVAAQRAAGGQAALLVPVTDVDLRVGAQEANHFLGHLADYRQAMAEVGTETGTLVIDLPTSAWGQGISPGRLMVDPVHPSGEGHRRLAAVTVAALRAGGLVGGEEG